VLFIGTQFSNLYTAVDTPAMGRVVSVRTGATGCWQLGVELGDMGLQDPKLMLRGQGASSGRPSRSRCR
jgi:hypothetical protein